MHESTHVFICSTLLEHSRETSGMWEKSCICRTQSSMHTYIHTLYMHIHNQTTYVRTFERYLCIVKMYVPFGSLLQTVPCYTALTSAQTNPDPTHRHSLKKKVIQNTYDTHTQQSNSMYVEVHALARLSHTRTPSLSEAGFW